MPSKPSTRQPPPSVELKRPIQPVLLDDLQASTPDVLFQSLVTTFQQHANLYREQLGKQKQLYTHYFKTLAECKHSSSSPTVKYLPCSNKKKNCKTPARFDLTELTMETDAIMERQAQQCHNDILASFFSHVDPRVCTQSLLALTRLKQLVDGRAHPGLLTLIWSSLGYLWDRLSPLLDFPPAGVLLRRACQIAAPAVAKDVPCTDWLLQVFANSPVAMLWLYPAFLPSMQPHDLFLQRFQQITDLLIPVNDLLPAHRHLLRAFDWHTWSSRANVHEDDSLRQQCYLICCDFIRHRHHDPSSSAGSASPSPSASSVSSAPSLLRRLPPDEPAVSLSMVYAEIMMNLMTSILTDRQQQGEHLYVMHLILDTIASTTAQRSDASFRDIVDGYTQALCSQDPQERIMNWMTQPADLPTQCVRLDDPERTLEMLLNIMQQHMAEHQGNASQVYGQSSLALARLMVVLVLDDRVDWSLERLWECFGLFWEPHDGAGLDLGEQMVDDICQLYECLLLHTLLFKTVDQAQVLRYYMETLGMERLDLVWMTGHYTLLERLPWQAPLVPLGATELALFHHQALQFITVDDDTNSRLVVHLAFLESLLLLDDYRLCDTLTEGSLVLSLLFMMHAPQLWPESNDRMVALERLCQLQQPAGLASNSDDSDHVTHGPRLSVNDLEHALEVLDQWWPRSPPTFAMAKALDSGVVWTGTDMDLPWLVMCLVWLYDLIRQQQEVDLWFVLATWLVTRLESTQDQEPKTALCYFFDTKDIVQPLIQAADKLYKESGAEPSRQWCQLLLDKVPRTVSDSVVTTSLMGCGQLGFLETMLQACAVKLQPEHLLVMEACLDRVLQQNQPTHSWPSLVASVLPFLFPAQQDQLDAWLHQSLASNCLLTIRLVCQCKCQYAAGADAPLADVHLAAEEMAALMSMLDVVPMACQKLLHLVRFFADCLSLGNHADALVDDWKASLVALVKVCHRWSSASLDANLPPKTTRWITLVEAFLASRLASMQVPPYDSTHAHGQGWMDQVKSVGKGDKPWQRWATEVLQDPSWTFWDLSRLLDEEPKS
ncbi:hypothetical protein DM01DRAFT_1387126 [Hesseltinella vesiculosa]|uniref:Uncharacterized protein n=1 Tax=Hesseltinella vesiculosa TaxID=101127 RepID=A0A1X2G331_9FUNG|nr:hypothetical protein DM01DRAFT_1387126 [Hesseltinella vesiculosa]